MDIIDYLLAENLKAEFVSTLIVLFGAIIVSNAHNIGVITIDNATSPEYSIAYLNIH